MQLLDMEDDANSVQEMECEEENCSYRNKQNSVGDSSNLKNEEDDLMVVKPSTVEDRASVLGCVIVGLFMESKYPPAMYEKLFQCQKIQQIFVQMRKEDRLLLIKNRLLSIIK